MIQMTRLVHHMFIERRRDLAPQTILHWQRHSNHRTEPSELHHRRKMDRLVRTLLSPNSGTTYREIRKFGILHIAPDELLDCKMSVVQSKLGLERLFPI